MTAVCRDATWRRFPCKVLRRVGRCRQARVVDPGQLPAERVVKLALVLVVMLQAGAWRARRTAVRAASPVVPRAPEARVV